MKKALLIVVIMLFQHINAIAQSEEKPELPYKHNTSLIKRQCKDISTYYSSSLHLSKKQSKQIKSIARRYYLLYPLNGDPELMRWYLQDKLKYVLTVSQYEKLIMLRTYSKELYQSNVSSTI